MNHALTLAPYIGISGSVTLPWRVILATCWKGEASVPTCEKSGVSSEVLQLVTVIREEGVRGRYKTQKASEEGFPILSPNFNINTQIDLDTT